ncbi:MAG TPA: hypothetical protein VEG62_06055 [Acidimicrobiales bacterium]|nr:hypothetical protein [Acidimicrobiales bacterium]
MRRKAKSGQCPPSVRAAVLLASAALVLSACGAINTVRQAVHDVEGNRSTIDSFTKGLEPSPATAFAATYTTTGSAPATIVYAVNPGAGDLAFHETQTGANASSTQLIVSSSGDYLCNQSGGTAPWSCQKLSRTDAEAQKQLFDVYTPAHWIDFLDGASFVAGLAGDKVSSSTMSLNGFAMDCVDLVASGVSGTSTICSTSQGILGYVKVASDSTSFEITDYTASPAPALFELPAGATVTTVTTGTTT